MSHSGHTDDHSTVQRVCGNCGNADAFYFTKREIAFDLYSMKHIFDTPCTQCTSTENAHLHIKAFPLDQAMLLEWGMHEELHFSQDDELFLSDRLLPDELLELIDHHDIFPMKRHVIFEALCVMIYDQLMNNEKPDLALAEHVKAELLKRHDQLLEADRVIMPYIKDVVYPFLGMELKA